MTLLSDSDIAQWIDDHDGWQRDGDALVRVIECPSFPAAIDLVAAVGAAAENADHHPDIDIRWRTLRFSLSTHSEGGITAKDTELASTIDELASQHR
jgi:4a-hydroxytetrahydrobiopterin dehydratase